MNQPTESAHGTPHVLFLMIKALRPHQWIKNILLVVPLLLAHELGDSERILSLLFAFLAFSAIASAMYLVNDLVDLQADRSHPTKQRRPIASGDVSVLQALVMTAGLGILGLLLAFLTLPRPFALMLALYLVTSGCYSLWLKRLAIIDVLILAGLYTLRILAGGTAVAVDVSEWLLAFSMFLFTSLAFAKRYVELNALDESAGDILAMRRRGYRQTDVGIIETMGITSGYLAVLVLALYINSKEMLDLYLNNWALWIICVLLLYWLSRLWLLAQRKQLPDDPVLFAIKDRTSWFIAILVAMLLVLAASKIPGQSVQRVDSHLQPRAAPDPVPRQGIKDREIESANHQRLG